jgi:hypothetical protein
MLESLEFLESRKSPRSSRGSRIEIEPRLIIAGGSKLYSASGSRRSRVAGVLREPERPEVAGNGRGYKLSPDGARARPYFEKEPQ